jgi:hypothetical protein
MNEHVELAVGEQGAIKLSFSDSLASELLSRIDCLVRQELPRLRGFQNPVLRLEGILVLDENPSSEIAEQRVSFGKVDLNA